jgi:hypothetical protein
MRARQGLDVAQEAEQCNVERLSHLRSTPPSVSPCCVSSGTACLGTLSSSCRSRSQGPAFGKRTNTPEPTSHHQSLPYLYRWWNAPAISLACKPAKRDPQTGTKETYRHSDNSIPMVVTLNFCTEMCDAKYIPANLIWWRSQDRIYLVGIARS